MATVVPATKSKKDLLQEAIGKGVGNFVSSAAESYKNQHDEAALRTALANLGPNASARDILDTLTQVKTYGPEAKQRAFENILGAEKFQEAKRQAMEQEKIRQAETQIKSEKEKRESEKANAERTNARSIVNQLNIPQEQKQELGETISQRAAEDLLKQQLKPAKTAEEKLTPFQKKVQEKNAEEYINLTKEIPKLQTTLDNIAYAKELSDSIGPIGYVGGNLGLSGKAKELQAVSFLQLEPILKVFNPVGAIPQQKIKLLEGIYVINPTDLPWVRDAKLKATERFTKQAMNRAQKKLALIQQYDGNPPTEELEKFDKESETLVDAMIDYDLTGEEATDKELPPPQDFKGTTITSPEGKKFRSDGTRWVKV